MVSPDIENWRPVPVPELCNIYQVSDHGRIRRAVPHIGKGRNVPVGYIMKLKKMRDGHLVVTLSHKGKQPKFLVHRLVLAAFVGLQPEGMEGCHNDGIPGNNRLSNLRWDTRMNNINDTRRHGRLNQGERNGTSILTDEKVRQIRLLRMQGAKVTHLARDFSVSPMTVSFIVNRKTWRHI